MILAVAARLQAAVADVGEAYHVLTPVARRLVLG